MPPDAIENMAASAASTSGVGIPPFSVGVDEQYEHGPCGSLVPIDERVVPAAGVTVEIDSLNVHAPAVTSSARKMNAASPDSSLTPNGRHNGNERISMKLRQVK